MHLTPHPHVLREAAEAMVRASPRSIAAIAAEMGLPEATIRNWSRRGGWRDPARRGAKPSPGRANKAGPAPSLDGAALRAALRRHVARQIARFDEALEGDALPDSARVLRDLGGLKRLLEDLALHETSDPGGRHEAGSGSDAGDGADEPDLPALRAQIARRYEAFAGERPDGGFPGNPAGAPAPGALA